MAKASTACITQKLSEYDIQADHVDELVAELAAHKEAVVEWLTVIEAMHQSGVLAITSGLLNATDNISKVLVEQVLKPQNTQLIKNVLTTVSGVGAVDPASLQHMLTWFTEGSQSAQSALDHPHSMGMMEMWRLLRDPDVMLALNAAFGFLKGFGHAIAESHPSEV